MERGTGVVLRRRARSLTITSSRGIGWSVWAGGLVIYLVGVFQRFTLGVRRAVPAVVARRLADRAVPQQSATGLRQVHRECRGLIGPGTYQRARRPLPSENGHAPAESIDWGTAVHLMMTVLVLVAGLFVVLAADTSPEMRLFGWFLVAIGVLGVAVAVLVRGRSRS